MKRLGRVTLLLLAVSLIVPTAFAGKKPRKVIKVPQSAMGALEIAGSTGMSFTDSLSNLSGETGTCYCPSLTGSCTAQDTFDNLAVVYISTYHSGISNGTLQPVLFTSGVKPDGYNVSIFNGVTVTLNHSGIPAGESYTSCIYYSIQFPAFFYGRTFPWGGGIYDGVNDRLQGQLGVLHMTNNTP